MFTIYAGKPVGLPFGSVWANGKQISVLGNSVRDWRLPFAEIPTIYQQICTTATARQRDLEGRKTKALINKTANLHVRYFWYISLPFCAQLQREMTKFNVCVERKHTTVNFRFYNNNNNNIIVITLFMCQVI